MTRDASVPPVVVVERARKAKQARARRAAASSSARCPHGYVYAARCSVCAALMFTPVPSLSDRATTGEVRRYVAERSDKALVSLSSAAVHEAMAALLLVDMLESHDRATIGAPRPITYTYGAATFLATLAGRQVRVTVSCE